MNRYVKCFATKANTMSQLMAHLPLARVSLFEKPFTNTAVDYTGEIAYKLNKTRNAETGKDIYYFYYYYDCDLTITL